MVFRIQLPSKAGARLLSTTPHPFLGDRGSGFAKIILPELALPWGAPQAVLQACQKVCSGDQALLVRQVLPALSPSTGGSGAPTGSSFDHITSISATPKSPAGRHTAPVVRSVLQLHQHPQGGLQIRSPARLPVAIQRSALQCLRLS